MQENTAPQAPEATAAPELEDDTEAGPGIYFELGKLPPSTPLTEDGLATILGKRCRESVKRAVDRGELPMPVKLMGKNLWTAGAIIRHLEDRLESEGRKFAKLRPGA